MSEEKYIYQVFLHCHHCERVTTKRIHYTAFSSKILEKRVGCGNCGNTGNRKGPIMFFYRDLGVVDDDGNPNAHVIVERIE